MSTATIEENKKQKAKEDEKDELLLDSLEIKGYRCFEHLTIEKLGRVNLIVGKNNVGKTALLEALWILFDVGNILQPQKELKLDVFYEILEKRNENKLSETFSGDKNTIFENLFKRTSEKNEIIIGNSSISNLEPYTFHFELKESPQEFNKNISLYNGEKSQNLIYTLRRNFIKTHGLENEQVAKLWDGIELRNEEKQVNQSLKFILPNLIQVRLRNVVNKNVIERIPYAQIEGLNKPLPLKSFGEGLNRLFNISLALVNSNNGVLLIDEIENGFHYSVLPDVWKLIFNTAKELNVQVFATTHSKDCIEAFAQAAYDSPEEGMLVRLERQGEKIVAKAIEEEMLVDAVDYGVEVR